MEYKTLLDVCTAEYEEKKSVFICSICPVESVEDAMDFLEKVKKQYRQANHHCYAYLLKDGITCRASDDGEPQGTAGIPMLNVLQKSGVLGVCAVVTRYFGGTLLGANGLVRAYSHAVSLALKQGTIITMCTCVPLTLTLPYKYYDSLQHMLPNYQLRTEGVDFTDQVDVKLVIPQILLENFLRDVREKFGVDIQVKQVDFFESYI